MLDYGNGCNVIIGCEERILILVRIVVGYIYNLCEVFNCNFI